MRIADKGMTVELANSDPRAARIRAILFEQPAGHAPVPTLWAACSDTQRQVLTALAEAGPLTQPDLERRLRITGLELRGRHSGLARIAKRVGVQYPIQTNPGRREARRFWLEPEVAAEILKLARKKKATAPSRR